MRVLFFDLEFAHSKNGGKICEFGYVVTNEKLEILRKENMIINPNIERNIKPIAENPPNILSNKVW